MKENLSKKTMLLMIVGIVTLLVVVVGATFAYFTSSNSATGSTMISGTTENLGSVTITNPTTEMHLRLKAKDMAEQAGGSSYYATTTSDDYVEDIEYKSVANIKVSGGEDSTTYNCTYDLTVSGSNVLEEGDAKVIFKTESISNVSNLEIEGITSEEEIDLKTGSNTYKVSFSVTGNMSETEMIKAGFKLNNLKSNQDHLKNETLTFSVENSNLECKIKAPYKDVVVAVSTDGVENTIPTTSGYKAELSCQNANYAYNNIYQRLEIGGLENSGAVCNLSYVANNDTKTYLKSKVEEVNASQNYDNNGYRYSGKTPNNWVWFNGEKWRIIGSLPTCTSSGCGTSENLVKIISAESIGVYAYEAKYTIQTTSWGRVTLYSLLNTHYYATNKDNMNGQSHAGCCGHLSSNYYTKPNCDYSEIGILADGYYGRMVKKVYWNTGASSCKVTPSSAYTEEIKTQTVSGYVGLMSASDWGYAADSSFHNTMMTQYTTSENNATETSWIFNNGNELTYISVPFSNTVIIADFTGNLKNGGANSGSAVRPVVYLDSTVYIVSGDGTEGNPYQIGM